MTLALAWFSRVDGGLLPGLSGRLRAPHVPGRLYAPAGNAGDFRCCICGLDGTGRIIVGNDGAESTRDTRNVDLSQRALRLVVDVIWKIEVSKVAEEGQS